MKLIIACFAFSFALGAVGEPWSAQENENRLLQDMKTFFRDAEVRFPGSSGNLVMEQRVAERFAGTGFEHGETKFLAPTFIPGQTSLTLHNGDSVTLYPMHPTLFRPGNFTENEFTAPLIYLGRGTEADLARLEGVDLEGSIALMDFDSGTAWLRFLRFGVRGFVFIGSANYERADALSKVYTSEVSVPRFLIKQDEAEKLKEAAKSGVMDDETGLVATQQVHVRAEPSRWENRFLRNLWVLVPGSDPDLSREVIVITAPIDSNCIVPEMATGAQSGANLYLLMQLLERFQADAPARSALIVAVNAHTQNFRGERMLAWYLLSDGVENVRDKLNADFREQSLLVNYYGQLELDTFRQEDEDTLIEWRTLVDDTTGKNISVKEAMVARARRDVNRLKEDRLQLIRRYDRGDLDEAEYEARQQEYIDQIDKYVSVLTLFNRVGIQTELNDLSSEENEILRDYVEEIITFNRSAMELNERDLTIDIQNSEIREALRGRRVSFVICLDLDWTSPQMGFSSMNVSGASRWAFRWGAAAYNIASQMDLVQNEGKTNLLLDTMTMRGGLGESYYFNLGENPIVQQSAITYFHNAGQTPAFSLMTAFAERGNAFLPTDSIDQLDVFSLAEGMVFIPRLFRSLFDDRTITASATLSSASMESWSHPLWSISARAFKFDELAASVHPDIPVSGSVVVLRPDNPNAMNVPLRYDAIAAGDVINADILLTDERAMGIIYAMRRGGVSSAYRLDADWVTVNHVIDAGETHRKVNSNNLRADLTMALFRCVEFPLYAMADPSMIGARPIVVRDILPLLAREDSSPRKFGLTGLTSTFTTKRVNPTAGAPAAFYFGPSERIKLMTQHRRLALGATPEEYEGKGFASFSDMGFDIFATMARDMSVLNRARLQQLRDIADELVRYFLERGDSALDKMKEAISGKRHLQYLSFMYQALGNHVKSYEQAKSITDDMLKAVVVYMALLLPFCLFVQKLLFKFVKIEHELAAFAILFVITFVVFRLVHPAFRIAQAAETIFIAFIMGALGLFVISILRSRFEGEMQLLFRSYQSGTHEDIGYSAVTQKALVIGVNNMKRRRIRTMLTTATIILIAFTMLSFTSISKRLNPTIVPHSGEPSYTGIMYHWPGQATMDEATLNVFKELFNDSGSLIVRRWLMAQSIAPFHVQSSAGVDGRFEGLLGLARDEDGFLGRVPLMGGRYFSSDYAYEALISTRAARLLQVDIDQPELSSLKFMGRTLSVVGVIDDERFRGVRDINNRPIIPIQRIARDTAFGREVAPDTVDEDIDLDEGLLSYIDVGSLLIVPVELSKRMGAVPYSVSVKFPEDAQIWPAVELLLTVTRAKFYMSSIFPFTFGDGDREVNSGVYYIGSNYSTSVGGLAVLLIPLFIASTIILNTMLGSVYERKKEIAVYNAVGLNPHHIGMFFLAEAFVYGVIGAVGGYLIGQFLSIVLNQLELVSEINLNYSSLSVAYVILFTIAVVLLSTLYPAVVATRAAVPSGKRKWSMPDHDGHKMKVVFPFIYHPRVAIGILAYLNEYFSRFTEASIGDLIATLEKNSRGKDAQGRDCFSLEYHVALAPYDLGVTQRLVFELAYNSHVQAYSLIMNIIRISGQDSNWVTTNRPFLEQIRKYLLRWRNLNISQQGLYVQEANVLLGKKENSEQ